MDGKVLGRIFMAEFGTYDGYPYLIGLHLGFNISNKAVMDGGKYTVNISSKCKCTPEERASSITELFEKVAEILKDAKVDCVSNLIGKPVEVTIEKNTFKDFRILTEVL